MTMIITRQQQKNITFFNVMIRNDSQDQLKCCQERYRFEE